MPQPGLARSDFHEVFEAQAMYVYGSLRRLGVRTQDIEDLTQDVFLAVYRHFGEYDPGRPLKPWLFGFAFRAASNYRKLARHRSEAKSKPPEAASRQASPEDETIRGQLAALLQHALDEVSDEHRAIFVMHELDGFAAKDIAETLGIPLNTAYSRIRLARRAMETKLEALDPKRGVR